jgi:hypothetical protein
MFFTLPAATLRAPMAAARRERRAPGIRNDIGRSKGLVITPISMFFGARGAVTGRAFQPNRHAYTSLALNVHRFRIVSTILEPPHDSSPCTPSSAEKIGQFCWSQRCQKTFFVLLCSIWGSPPLKAFVFLH